MAEDKHLAWVTGAGSGIGKAVALGLARIGYTVVASGRHEEPLAELRNDDGGAAIHPLPCDVTSDASVGEAAAHIVREFGPVDVLVNSAGTTVFRALMDTTLEEFDRILSVNLRGAYLCARAALPMMLERGSGTVVMINSQAAETAFKNSAAYAASKAGSRPWPTACGWSFAARACGCFPCSPVPR